MAITDLKEHLAEQAEALLTFGVLQNKLQEAVLHGDWDTLDSVVPDLHQQAARIEELDIRRTSLVQEVKADAGVAADAPFSELLERLGEEDRAMVNSLYRKLQVAVWKVQNVSRGIDSYLRTRIRTTRDVLGELFPERKGTIYGKSGSPAPVGGSALVLDRHL
jgi:Glu-tRNA(Gln) amidotransferase subunit E-like FAD-binding protein